MRVKEKPEEGLPAILSFDMGAGFTIQNNNELVMEKTATEMQVPAGMYVYDLQRTQANGRVTTELTGNFKVLSDIS